MWNYVTTAVTPTPPGLWNNQYPVQAIVEVFCRPAMTSIKNTDDGTNGYILRATPRHLPSYMPYNFRSPDIALARNVRFSLVHPAPATA